MWYGTVCERSGDLETQIVASGDERRQVMWVNLTKLASVDRLPALAFDRAWSVLWSAPHDYGWGSRSA